MASSSAINSSRESAQRSEPLVSQEPHKLDQSLARLVMAEDAADESPGARARRVVLEAVL